jgi:hypothetical protein
MSWEEYKKKREKNKSSNDIAPTKSSSNNTSKTVTSSDNRTTKTNSNSSSWADYKAKREQIKAKQQEQKAKREQEAEQRKAEQQARQEKAPVKQTTDSVVRINNQENKQATVKTKAQGLDNTLMKMNNTKNNVANRPSELFKGIQNQPNQPIQPITAPKKDVTKVKAEGDKNFFERVGEGAKKVGNTALGTAGNLLMGIEGTIPKAVKYIDTAKDYAVEKASKVATNIILGEDNPFNNIVSKTISNTVNKTTDKTSFIGQADESLNSEEAEKWRKETIQANTERAKQGGVVGEFANDVALGVGGNIIPMGLALIPGGQVASASLFMSSAGGSYLEDAEQRGMEGGRALGYATGMGIVEGGTDWLINGKVLNSVAKKVASKELFSKATLKSLGVSSLENALQEGGTEYISEAGAELASLGTDEEYANWEDIHSRAARSALVGAVSGIIMQGAGNGIYKAAYVSNVQNNTNNAIKTAQEQLGRELTVEEQEEIKVQIKENIAKKMMDTEDLSAEEKAEIEELSKMSDEDMVSTVVERLVKNKEVDVEEVVSGVKEAMETTAQKEEVQQEQTQQEETVQNETDPMLQQAKEEANRLFEEIQQKQAEQKATEDTRNAEILQEQIQALEEERAPLLKQIEETNTKQYSEKLTKLEETKEAYKDNPIVVEAIDNQIKQIKQDAKTEKNEYIAPISSKEVAEQTHTENQNSLEETEAPIDQNALTEEEQDELNAYEEYLADNNLTEMEDATEQKRYEYLKSKIDGEEVNTNDVAIDESKTDAKTRLKDYFNLNKNETKELYGKISKANSVEQTREILEGYKDINETIEDKDIKDVKKYLRETAIDTSNLKVTDKKSLMNSAFGQVKFKKGGASIDTVYQELSNMYPGHFSEDVINPEDQLEHIIDFVTGNTIKSTTKVGEISNEDLNGLAEELYTEVHANEFNNDADYQNSLKDLDKVIDNAEIQTNAINEVKNKVTDLTKQIDNLSKQLKELVPTQKAIENNTENIQEIDSKETENVGLDEKIPAKNDISLETNEKIPISEVDTLLTNDITSDEKTSQNQNMKVKKESNIKNDEEKAAKIMSEAPTAKNKDQRMWAKFVMGIFDKGAPFEKLALKTKKRDLMAKWDYMLTSESRAQNTMLNGFKEIDALNGVERQVSKSLNDLRAQVGDRVQDFSEYLYHKHNISRMSIEKNAQTKMAELQNTILKEYDVETIEKLSRKKADSNIDKASRSEQLKFNLKENTNEADIINAAKEYMKLSELKNKPVFGKNVTADVSQNIVNEFEMNNPEFMDWANDVYDYNKASLNLLVENGVISQETADTFAEIYPNYVPIARADVNGNAINVPLDTNRTTVNTPIARAKGGNQDILPLFDTMAKRTIQTYKAISKNSFGVELKNSLVSKTDNQATNIDEVLENVDQQENLLQEGKNGENPTFTVFENGEKVTYEITQEMYEALKPVSDSSILSTTFKPFNKISNFHRGVLTEYNPVFMLTNSIKDFQDVLLNSQHSAKTYSKFPEAYAQILKKGMWYKEYMANGGEQNSYFDSQEGTFDTTKKGISKILDLPPLKQISQLNNIIEMSPRLAEYIASREAGRSIETSMLDAARVTTNFKAGGDVTKWANRNGATFLNASIQGAMQQVRNVREAHSNGLKGYANLASKFVLAGVPAMILNSLLWGDDEDYEELSDYAKQSYYILGKYGDGNFIRIPKGRMVTVVQEGLNQMSNLVTGNDEADLGQFLEILGNNIAPNNPVENNVLSPIMQAASNTTWYGDDLVPTRLQNEPAEEQFDESTDKFSIALGQKTGISPYKINYVLDQYSGGVGDVLLPMMTQQAETGKDNIGEKLIAPLTNKFTVDSVMKNQNVSDLYEKSEELTSKANSTSATDEDVLKNKYLNSIKSKMNLLYKEKREIQSSNLSDSEKYNQVREIQKQINDMAENALENHEDTTVKSNYSKVGDIEFYKNTKNEWEKLDDEEAEDLKALSLNAKDKNTYFKTKSEISKIVSNFKEDKEDIDIDVDSDEYKEMANNLSSDKKKEIATMVLDSGLDSKTKAYIYKKSYQTKAIDKIVESADSFDSYLEYEVETAGMDKDSEKESFLKSANYTKNDKTLIYENAVLSDFDDEKKYKGYKTSKAAEIDIDTWFEYSSQEFKSDKNSEGKSISGSKKKKVINFVNNSLDLTIPQKAILIKATNTFKFNDYNYDILDYVDNLNIDYDEKKKILENMDMKVDGNSVTWE